MSRLNQLIDTFGLTYMFPLIPEDKKPYGDLLHKMSYRDELPTSKMLKDFELNNPDCNWAFMSGEQQNLTVIDVDNSPDKKGHKWLSKIIDFKPDIECRYLVETPHGLHYYFNHSKVLGGTNINKDIGVDILNGKQYLVAPYSKVKCTKEWCSNYGQLEEYKLVKDNRLNAKGNIPSTTTLFSYLDKSKKKKKSRKHKKKKSKSEDPAIWNSKLAQVSRKEFYKDNHKGNTNNPLKSIDTINDNFNLVVKPEPVQFQSTILAYIRRNKRKELEPKQWGAKPSDNDVAKTLSVINEKKKKEEDFNRLILKCNQGNKSARKYAKKNNINWKIY